MMILGELIAVIPAHTNIQLVSHRNISKIVRAEVIPKDFYSLKITEIISTFSQDCDYNFHDTYLNIFLETSKSVAMTKAIKAYEDKLYGRFRKI